MWFDDLVIIARVSHPIPFRTRPLNLFALMVLCLKARESKSLPDLQTIFSNILLVYQKPHNLSIVGVFDALYSCILWFFDVLMSCDYVEVDVLKALSYGAFNELIRFNLRKFFDMF